MSSGMTQKKTNKYSYKWDGSLVNVYKIIHNQAVIFNETNSLSR